MRLTAGKTEYDLPLDCSKVTQIYIRVDGRILAIYELPQSIPQNQDMSHITRGEAMRKEKYPKESIPVAYTVYPPKRRRKKQTIVFIPAPSKNWSVELNYYAIRTV